VIVWGITTPGRKMMPLDATPNPAGNVVHVENRYTPQGARVVRVLTKAEQQAPATDVELATRFMPHHATCPKWGR
jgi:hypothetical protein